ncbi:hypothetical protein GCM10023097_63690 [Streptomyces collinus]
MTIDDGPGRGRLVDPFPRPAARRAPVPGGRGSDHDLIPPHYRLGPSAGERTEPEVRRTFTFYDTRHQE